MSDEPIVFYASFPSNAIAIRMHGDGGYRITLDVPESEADTMMAFAKMRGKTMVLTAQVQEIEENRTNGKESAKTEDRPRTARRPTDVASSRVQRPTDTEVV